MVHASHESCKSGQIDAIALICTRKKEKKTNAKRERIIIAPMRLNDDLLVAVVAFEPFSDPIVASVIHCCTYDDDY